MTPEETIKAFVEASIAIEEFEKIIYSDEAIEALLRLEKELPAYIAEPDLYTYVISQNYRDPGSIYNIQTLLSEFLLRKNIKHNVNEKYRKLFELTLDVQPKWLDLPLEYFSRSIEGKENLKPKELKIYLKEKIKADFRFLKIVPKWLQGPKWPIHGGHPLIFAGQIDISGLAHDSSQLYIFFDDRNGEFTNITQSC